MEKIDAQTQEKISQLQVLEQNLQSLLMQKQAFQMELNETENALKELKENKDDIHKLVGQIMIKVSKQTIEKELKQKKDIIELRMKSIEKQENYLKEETEKIRKEVLKKIK